VPDYDSEPYEEQWIDRFPDWAIGIEEWRTQPNPFERNPADGLDRWLPDLRSRDNHGIPFHCPRLFVSYRQSDRAWALRIAWLAKQKGFDFWLDVMDPKLNHPSVRGLPPPQRAIATASIIEMGLLNCSHIIALITPNTKGSEWVPYEYGRVKDVPPTSIQAACWRHPDHPMAALPEYLLLGVVNHSEAQIESWLEDQLKDWIKRHRRCTAGSDRSWSGPDTDPLPAKPTS
jgi:hypothetical protein